MTILIILTLLAVIGWCISNYFTYEDWAVVTGTLSLFLAGIAVCGWLAFGLVKVADAKGAAYDAEYGPYVVQAGTNTYFATKYIIKPFGKACKIITTNGNFVIVEGNYTITSTGSKGKE